jgi:hypothetical protein
MRKACNYAKFGGSSELPTEYTSKSASAWCLFIGEAILSWSEMTDMKQAHADFIAAFTTS